jgi:hypothetical protein
MRCMVMFSCEVVRSVDKCFSSIATTSSKITGRVLSAGLDALEVKLNDMTPPPMAA